MEPPIAENHLRRANCGLSINGKCADLWNRIDTESYSVGHPNSGYGHAPTASVVVNLGFQQSFLEMGKNLFDGIIKGGYYISMKAYKIELIVVDFEDYGAEACAQELLSCKYICPSLLSLVEADIGEWDDDHPLNLNKTTVEEKLAYFK